MCNGINNLKNNSNLFIDLKVIKTNYFFSLTFRKVGYAFDNFLHFTYCSTWKIFTGTRMYIAADFFLLLLIDNECYETYTQKFFFFYFSVLVYIMSIEMKEKNEAVKLRIKYGTSRFLFSFLSFILNISSLCSRIKAVFYLREKKKKKYKNYLIGKHCLETDLLENDQ